MKIFDLSNTINTYDQTAEEYSTEHSDINDVKSLLDRFIRNVPGKKILDVGCGPGRDAKYLSEKGLRVTGIDLSKNLLSIAAKKAPKAEFLQMDMADLNFTENAFEGIWACASFLHVPKKEAGRVLEGFNRVLKPGGLIFIGVKEGEDEKIIYGKFFSFYHQEEIISLLRSANFEIKEASKETKACAWIQIFAVKKA